MIVVTGGPGNLGVWLGGGQACHGIRLLLDIALGGRQANRGYVATKAPFALKLINKQLLVPPLLLPPLVLLPLLTIPPPLPPLPVLPLLLPLSLAQ